MLCSFLNSYTRHSYKANSGKELTRFPGTDQVVVFTVITACGIILAGTFGVLVITPIRTLMQIGAAVAIGVIIDTFLVRALPVPAITSLMGRWNW